MVTIITINLNNLKGLESTFSSLDAQKKNIFEFIVIDGFSSDGSRQYLLQKSHLITNYISEKDTGIYDAMNKGIAMAFGTRLLFLNSGDTIKKSLDFYRFITQYPDKDIVYSNISKVFPDDDKSVDCRFPDYLSLEYMICYGLPHQATIINKVLFDKIGLYNEQYKIISDWVFFMEALFYHNASYHFVDLNPICFDGTGISNQNSQLKLIIKEQLDYISKRFPDKINVYKTGSPYVKKYFRQIPRWRRPFNKFIFLQFNHI